MFITSEGIVLDPVDMEPILVLWTTHQRKARCMIRRFGNFKVRTARKEYFFGILMWKLYVSATEIDDIKALQKAIPRRIIVHQP